MGGVVVVVVGGGVLIIDHGSGGRENTEDATAYLAGRRAHREQGEGR